MSQSLVSANRTFQLALVMIFAALYAAMTIVFAPFSYLILQSRVSEILIAFIPFYGWPVVLGLTMGTLLSNVISPLGLIDLLVGTLATFLGALPVYALKRYPRYQILGFVAYAVIVSVIVTFELSLVFSLPFLLVFPELLIGESLSAVLGASLLYLQLRRTSLPYTAPPIVPESMGEESSVKTK